MEQPANYEVRLGMSHAEVLEKAGGLHDEAEKIISGGPMMGMAMYDLNTPVVKTSSSILALSTDDELHSLRPLCQSVPEPSCSTDDDTGNQKK